MTDRPWNRKLAARLWKGLAGMPLALRLNEGLGICKRKQLIDMPFKQNLVVVNVYRPFFRNSVVLAHRCRLAVLFPSLLVPVASGGSNEAAENFNGSTVRQEGFLDMGINVRPVVGAVVTGYIDECQRWREGSTEGCTRSTPFGGSSLPQGQFMLLSYQVQGKPVGHECADQSPERGGKQLIGHGGYISWEVLLFLGGLLGGSEFILWMWRRKWIRMPNVRAKRAPTAWRAGQQAQNGPQAQRLMASATCRWRSA